MTLALLKSTEQKSPALQYNRSINPTELSKGTRETSIVPSNLGQSTVDDFEKLSQASTPFEPFAGKLDESLGTNSAREQPSVNPDSLVNENSLKNRETSFKGTLGDSADTISDLVTGARKPEAEKAAQIFTPRENFYPPHSHYDLPISNELIATEPDTSLSIGSTEAVGNEVSVDSEA